MYGRLSTHVLRCDGAPVPIALAALPTTQTAAIPDTAVIDELLPVLAADSLPRLIVLGEDAALAAVLTHLMRTERLHVEIGYVPIDKTYGSRAYQTGTGNAAAKRAIEGKARETPLIRDDTGKVLVGRATITGPEGGKLEGEAYVDDTQLFSGKVTAMHISPTLHMPGVRATVRKGLRKRRWVEGRAAQLGTPGAVVTRDGILTERTVPRSTFYRHNETWLLVR
ncbi:hypothetical protein SAMN04244553_4672 [Nocardia amikacinitolerans]|uniref:Peptidase M50 n=1 Tax=Nocardia amikacinitolerans TaxID=756689 RepID=A0A285LS22_9NOCA|nr:hypothetical protein [Nocardia amikacinitolerans]MCP2276327.1 hypothetical protein [Nocardia amikacinitolerans]MCP2295295.1 hypothetical protein [Nocardia amikacinitolerans]MCP2319549.1 hypothetical protein [Nocardia amikacinitolerans]SNY87722.1 hypothetical protein SAMN04244553_4672 [Nocardia amikacinitolerans]